MSTFCSFNSEEVAGRRLGSSASCCFSHHRLHLPGFKPQGGWMPFSSSEPYPCPRRPLFLFSLKTPKAFALYLVVSNQSFQRGTALMRPRWRLAGGAVLVATDALMRPACRTLTFQNPHLNSHQNSFLHPSGLGCLMTVVSFVQLLTSLVVCTAAKTSVWVPDSGALGGATCKCRRVSNGEKNLFRVNLSSE